MSFKKKDLEIVYSLRWKNGPKREDKKQMSIVAVYDIPATTLNFEVFKSYLLKNSGTAEDDVSVFYIMDNGKEYPIQSQTDFQVALYAFRRKARAGEVINLLLERISDQPIHKNLRHSNDVETQFDNMEQHSIVSTCCNADTAPEWFIAGLAQLKKEMKEEMTANVSTIVANAIADLKSPFASPPAHHAVCPHRIRNKPDKRLRKLTPHLSESAADAKDLIKTLKLENKLEKLDRKASKYREKRLALLHGQKSSDNGPKSSDSEAGHSSSRSRSRDKEEKRKLEEQKRKAEEQQKHKSGEEPKMDAIPLNVQTSIPHMLGGEIYLHQWDVQNTGEAQWTSMTQLQYTWGSKKLVPVEKTVLVPYLKPGEKGTLSVRLHIPTQSGKYECYWQFTHKGRRFGHWLGLQVIVDSFDLKGHSSVLQKTSPLDLECNFRRENDAEEYEKLLRSSDSETPKKSMKNGRSAEALASFYKSDNSSESAKNMTDQLVKEVSDNLEGLQVRRDPAVDFITADLYKRLDRIANEEELDSDFSWSSGPSSYWCKINENGDSVLVPVPKRDYAIYQKLEEFPKNANQPKQNTPNLEQDDSEPTHFWTKSDEKGGFVVVPVPQCFVLDTPEGSDNTLTKKDDSTPAKKEEKLVQPEAGPSTSGVQTSAPQEQKHVTDNFDDNNNKESASRGSGGSIKLRDEELDNIVVITVPKDEQVKEGFIYVHVDGQKVLIPKNILKSEVVSAAKELEKSPSSTNSIGVIIDSNESLNKSPTPSMASTITNPRSVQPEPEQEDDASGNVLDSVPPKTLEDPIIPQSAPIHENVAVDLSTAARENIEYPLEEGVDRSNYFEANNYMSHCSAAGSCYSEVNSQAERQNRLFIFPRDVPGYEVVYPVLDLNDPSFPNLCTETHVPHIQPPHPTGACATGVAYNIPQQQVPNPFVEHVPNFQQTPPELRRAPVDHASEPTVYEPPCQERLHEHLGAPWPEGDQRQVFEEEVQQPRSGAAQGTPPTASAPQVHILPETLVSGAVNVASSAINTARSVINMIKPQAPGRWINGHWISSNPETPREANLQALAEMGFWNRDLNATLLARFNDDLNRVVAELVQ